MPTRAKPSQKAKKAAPEITEGALPAEALAGEFPEIDLPLRPPYPPMEAASEDELPKGEGWLYEPKWDGFRCLAFRKGKTVLLQSKAGQPLGRYFPELVAALGALPLRTFVLDGEIVIRAAGGSLDFDALLQRIHPAISRIRKLAGETPGTLLAFDLLVDERGKALDGLPLAERRERLERFFDKLPEEGSAVLSPATPDRKVAEGWLRDLGGGGLDGVVAKRLDEPYLSGERSMVKIKRQRTADCVVGGFRYAQKGGAIGSLLLGLYDGQGKLDHVGFSSSFTAAEQQGARADPEAADRAPRLHRQGPRRPQPLEPRPLDRVGAAAPRPRLRGALRPLLRRPLPPRHQVPALAAGQAARAVHLRAGAAAGGPRGSRRPGARLAAGYWVRLKSEDGRLAARSARRRPPAGSNGPSVQSRAEPARTPCYPENGSPQGYRR